MPDNTSLVLAEQTKNLVQKVFAASKMLDKLMLRDHTGVHRCKPVDKSCQGCSVNNYIQSIKNTLLK